MAKREKATLTVKDVTIRYGVQSDAVLRWIHSGELRAINLQRDPHAERPRWRILPADLDAFERSRSNHSKANHESAGGALTAKEFV